MSSTRPRARKTRKKPPKRVLALPDLEHAKSAVLASGQASALWSFAAGRINPTLPRARPEAR